MKVNETLGNRPSIRRLQRRDDRNILESRSADFQDRLKYAEYRNHEERLNELADKIIKQGEKLGKKIDIREFRLYKKLLSEFLDEAVGGSLNFSKESFLDRRGRHKIYAIVRKINAELEELTREMLNRERDNIKVLQKLDDIRGLILDMLM